MSIDHSGRKQRTDAAVGDHDALAALVREHGRGVREVLAAHVERWEAVERLEATVWTTVRKDSAAAHDLAGLAREAASRHLDQADRDAIQGRDVLRRLVVQVALEDLRGSPPTVAAGDQVRERLPHLPEEQRRLLELYYARGIALQHLALQRNVQLAELAHDVCAARAACDWRPGVQAPAGDRLLPSLTEDLLSDTLDPDSRALLATSVTQDLGRSVRLERQVRLHVLLRAVLGPFADQEVQAIVAAATGQGDPARAQTASAVGSGRTRVRPSEVVRSPISGRRPVGQAGERQPWMIPAVIVGALAALGLAMFAGRGPGPAKAPSTAGSSAPRVESATAAAPTSVAVPAPAPAQVPTPGASALRPQQLTAGPQPAAAPERPPVSAPAPVEPVEPAKPAAKPAPASLETVTLINADTDKPIPGYESLPLDATIRLSQLPTRRINFEFRAPSEIRSLTFTIPGCSLRKDGVEKGRPFSLSNTGPDYKPWTPAPGNYTLTLSACSDGEGKKVVRRTTWRIRFE